MAAEFLSVLIFESMDHPDRSLHLDAVLQGKVPMLKLLISIALLTRTCIYQLA
jgi:hypothetical protein